MTKHMTRQMQKAMFAKQRFPIPSYAKREAREALKLRESLPKSRQFGLDREEANKLGIQSGVQRAKQILNSDSVSLEDAKSISKFSTRFKNCNTFKCKGSLKLWGGKRWGLKLKSDLNKIHAP